MNETQERINKTFDRFMDTLNLAQKGLITAEFFLKRCIELQAEYKDPDDPNCFYSGGIQYRRYTDGRIGYERVTPLEKK